MTAAERWPHLQRFLSESVPDVILGTVSNASTELRRRVASVEAAEQVQIASECWNFLHAFKYRYDDWGFLRDGFGLTGKPPADYRGAGQTALASIKLLYDVLAEAIRKQQPDWKPQPGDTTGS